MMQVAYRATVYALATGGVETTPLTPVSASHTDAFKVSTIQALSGFQPYMGLPKGQKCSVSLPSAKLTVGTLTFTVQDQRLTPGGSNFIRWASAFLSDASKRLQLIGRKVVMEESIDGGSNWSLYFVGRITKVTLASGLAYQLEVSDSVEDMKRQIFLPNVTPSDPALNVVTELLHPFGVTAPLFDAPAATPIAATVVGVINSTGDIGVMVKDTFALNNQLSQNFLSSVPTLTQAHPVGTTGSRFDTQINVSIGTSPSASNPLGQVRLERYLAKTSDSPDPNSQYLYTVRFFTLTPSSSNYVPPTAFSANQTVYFTVLPSNPTYYFKNVHPLQVVKSIFDGNLFGTTGSAITIPYDSTLTNLIADTSIPNATFKITQPMAIVDFIEKYVCQPYSLAYCTKPGTDSNGQTNSVVQFFKTTLPTSASFSILPTLTDDTDVIAGNKVNWTAGVPLSNVQMTYYVDRFNPLVYQDQTNVKTTFISTPVLIQSLDTDTYLPNSTLQIDANGIRGGLFYISTGSESGSLTVDGDAYSLFQPILNRWAFGAPAVSLTCLRTSTVTNSNVGDWLLVDVDKLPNQATNLRGGVRLMQVAQKSEQGSTVLMHLIDGALNSSSASPTVGNLTLLPSNAAPVVALPVTASFAGTITFQVLAGAIGEPTPNDTDSRWRSVDNQSVNNGSVLMQWYGANYGIRVFGRARNEGNTGHDVSLPSPWVDASNYVDVEFLDPPTGLGVTQVTSKSALAGWITGSAFPIEVNIASPPTASFQVLAQLQTGTTQYLMTGLDALSSPTMSVGIRHTDQFGGYSTMVTCSFIAVNPPPQLSPPAFGEVFIGS
jgi:hypothetical protein